jgi:hydrogenase maturation protease
MSVRLVDRVANALLYEGYLLYPYRPSAVKNRQRFNFGVLHPDADTTADSSGKANRNFLSTECLVRAPGGAALEVTVRFLQLVERIAVRDEVARSWQEAVERELELRATLAELAHGVRRPFAFPADERVESIEAGNDTVGLVTRRQRALEGEIETRVRPCASGVSRVQVRVVNRTSTAGVDASRDEQLLRSLVSAHVILTVEGGAFVSLFDPPGSLAELTESCVNIGAWPVLAGEHRSDDTMLASPIILYDHPEIAPESPGDLFDGTEIDEILSLRILTLTDDEKREMAESDARARLILQRTEALAAEDMLKLHGTLRRPEKDPL